MSALAGPDQRLVMMTGLPRPGCVGRGFNGEALAPQQPCQGQGTLWLVQPYKIGATGGDHGCSAMLCLAVGNAAGACGVGQGTAALCSSLHSKPTLLTCTLSMSQALARAPETKYGTSFAVAEVGLCATICAWQLVLLLLFCATGRRQCIVANRGPVNGQAVWAPKAMLDTAARQL
jgi:hypothetical protein